MSLCSVLLLVPAPDLVHSKVALERSRLPLLNYQPGGHHDLELGHKKRGFCMLHTWAKILRGRAKCLGLDVGMATGPKEKLAGEQRN